VKDDNGRYDVVGVIEVDKVQNEFLSCLRSGETFSRMITAQEESIEHDCKTLLVFHIPESDRRDKPIYLHGDIRQSFIRRGACDQRCTPQEIERFLRDAAEPYDRELIEDLDAESFFHPQSVAWYRRCFNEFNPGRQESLADVEFLNEWGFIVEARDRLLPTRAAVLLFGLDRYVRQVLPRPVADCQFIDGDFDQWSADMRWHDRMVAERNIVQAWLSLAEFYRRHAELPFGVDTATLRRHDSPPDYISFREAAVNLLIHQDYGDHTRKPAIKFFRDRTTFWNPGDAFAATELLLDPTEKEVRNPAIVGAFRRIGLSDQAGTGVRSIFSAWLNLGNVPPLLHNNKGDKTFELVLVKEELLTEEQRLFQAELGVHLAEPQARLFAYACRKGTLDITDAKAVTGLSGPDARKALDHLALQMLVQPLGGGAYKLAEHLEAHFAPAEPDAAAASGRDLRTAQVGRQVENLISAQVAPRQLSAIQRQVLFLCDVPRSLSEIMQEMGVTHRGFFARHHLRPLLERGVIRMTNPENPRAANQKYVLTPLGAELKARHLTEKGRSHDR
jgi:ATP-dependent DNA helicase RecG